MYEEHTDRIQEQYDQQKELEASMARMEALGQVPAEELSHGQVIIDPEGNEATVIRIQRMDHERGLLHTDLGKAVVPLNQKFTVIP